MNTTTTRLQLNYNSLKIIILETKAKENINFKRKENTILLIEPNIWCHKTRLQNPYVVWRLVEAREMHAIWEGENSGDTGDSQFQRNPWWDPIRLPFSMFDFFRALQYQIWDITPLVFPILISPSRTQTTTTNSHTACSMLLVTVISAAVRS